MIGTPASCIAVRAAVLIPISSIAAGGGPIQTRPGVLDGLREARHSRRGSRSRDGSPAPRSAAPRRGSALPRGSSRRPASARAGTPRRRTRRGARRDRPRSRRRPRRSPSSRSVRKTRIAISPRLATRTFSNMSGPYSPRSGPDRRPIKLTVARAASVPIVVVLYAWSFSGHDYWATAVFCVAMTTDWFDGRLARRQGRSSRSARSSIRSPTRCSCSPRS